MILSRYLTKEVVGSLLAVTLGLLLIFLSQQLVRYLSYAAAGKLASNVLMQLLGFEIPYLIAILLPLGLYLGIILAYGRLYAENEMSVMLACGLSQRQLVKITATFTLAFTVGIAMLTLVINPWIAVKKEHALANAMSIENVLANMIAGRFQVTHDGKRVVYVENISRNRRVADNLFFADQVKPATQEGTPSVWSVVSAARAYQQTDTTLNRHFLVAENGYRYEGVPGQNDYKIIKFQKYSVLVPGVSLTANHHDTESLSTWKLLHEYKQPYEAAELQWRISLPLSAFLLALLGIQMSYVRPRQGRYATIFPAVLFYVVYMDLLFVARNWVEQKTIPVALGLWWVHLGVIAIIASVIFFRSTMWRQWMKRL